MDNIEEIKHHYYLINYFFKGGEGVVTCGLKENLMSWENRNYILNQITSDGYNYINLAIKSFSYMGYMTKKEVFGDNNG